MESALLHLRIALALRHIATELQLPVKIQDAFRFGDVRAGPLNGLTRRVEARPILVSTGETAFKRVLRCVPGAAPGFLHSRDPLCDEHRLPVAVAVASWSQCHTERRPMTENEVVRAGVLASSTEMHFAGRDWQFLVLASLTEMHFAGRDWQLPDRPSAVGGSSLGGEAMPAAMASAFLQFHIALALRRQQQVERELDAASRRAMTESDFGGFHTAAEWEDAGLRMRHRPTGASASGASGALSHLTDEELWEEIRTSIHRLETLAAPNRLETPAAPDLASGLSEIASDISKGSNAVADSGASRTALADVLSEEEVELEPTEVAAEATALGESPRGRRSTASRTPWSSSEILVLARVYRDDSLECYTTCLGGETCSRLLNSAAATCGSDDLWTAWRVESVDIRLRAIGHRARYETTLEEVSSAHLSRALRLAVLRRGFAHREARRRRAVLAARREAAAARRRFLL
ncbi:unnamed protein product [Symbiodinium sp. CCMP2592]|nr:unnamed protein product [Symbiodinium sp. CCMP2592]